MTSVQDIVVSAVINFISALVFLFTFAIVRLQPIDDRVYFTKWYLKDIRASPRSSGSFVNKFVNLDFRTYIRFLNWMPAALNIPEQELIGHAGLHSAVYICIYLLSLKIFVLITTLSFAVLVLVRNVPPDPDESVSEHVEHFFHLNHSDHYLSHQVLNGNPYNRKCNMYSFGIILWEIYSCDKPYPDLSFSEVTSVVVRQWPEMDELVSMIEAIGTSKGQAIATVSYNRRHSLTYGDGLDKRYRNCCIDLSQRPPMGCLLNHCGRVMAMILLPIAAILEPSL
ncbi:hypothetical protein BC332_18782 [Capsicum chinense]|nr:hypothetical protein BC332_18782 [Capsicum chinense]